MITGKLYDWLKYLAQIVLPALGTLYFTLAGIWGLPSADEVVGTVMAVDLFLGVLLGISQVNYQKNAVGQGDLIVEHDEAGQLGMRLALNQTPEELVGKKEVRFEVKKKASTQPKRRR
jgi:hypothetical protein